MEGLLERVAVHGESFPRLLPVKVSPARGRELGRASERRRGERGKRDRGAGDGTSLSDEGSAESLL